MKEVRDDKKQPLASRLIISALALSRITTRTGGILMGLFLVDIGLTFGTSVGVIGQIPTLSSVIAMVFALLMGVLSVRYSYKALLRMGLLLYAVSSLGCTLAPNYVTILLSYSLTGIGIAMVNPMSIALVGEHIPLDRRPTAIGWIFTAMALSSSFIAGPVMTYLSGFGGWRMAFLGYSLPIAIISIVLSYIGIPTVSSSPAIIVSEKSFLKGFREMFRNRSAVACLIGSVLSEASFTSIIVYGISFYREKFLVPRELTALLWAGMPLSFSIGSQFSGRFVNMYGRKPLTVLGLLLSGLFTVLYTNTPGFWLSVTLAYLTCMFAGVRNTASNSLTVEQIPEFRGTMMSLNTASSSLGSALGSALGGLMLVRWGWELFGSVLGSLGIVASLVYHLLTIDPTVFSSQ
jgi:predicted MFS family arabinose efflux permease